MPAEGDGVEGGQQRPLRSAGRQQGFARVDVAPDMRDLGKALGFARPRDDDFEVVWRPPQQIVEGSSHHSSGNERRSRA